MLPAPGPPVFIRVEGARGDGRADEAAAEDDDDAAAGITYVVGVWSVVGMVMVDGGENGCRCGVCRFLILGDFLMGGATADRESILLQDCGEYSTRPSTICA